MPAVVAPERLRHSGTIASTLRTGQRRAGRYLAVHAASGAAGVRLAVVASRRVGGAVQRNRAKRLLREAARPLPWRDGHDIVLVARADCARSGLAPVTAELRRLAGALTVLDS